MNFVGFKTVLPFISRVALGLGLATSACITLADEFPSKPVRIVVPYTPGGPTDAIARALASKLGAALGGTQQVVVDNRGGANEMVGIPVVTQAAPDGYTLLFHSDAALSLNALLYKKLSYDPKDLSPLTRVATSQMVIAVPDALPVKSLKDLVAYAQKNPKAVSYGTGGAGSNTHLGMAWISKRYNAPMNDIHYKGIAPALVDLMGGSVQAVMGAPSVMIPHAKSGKLRILGISGQKRAVALPTVPTYTESGFPDIDESFYMAISLPVGVPTDIRRKLLNAIQSVVKDPEFRKNNLDSFGMDPVVESTEDFSKFLTSAKSLYQKKIDAAGLIVE